MWRLSAEASVPGAMRAGVGLLCVLKDTMTRQCMAVPPHGEPEAQRAADECKEGARLYNLRQIILQYRQDNRQTACLSVVAVVLSRMCCA
jgi:hypothetical protein